ncbi:CU044_2847 family protein [Micromonospora sp. CA-249363]|uniref:CU044_2847 family protein n=1 Tax=Micromonospora sp. CA-249363 TaxID=3239963 RepID=UPI003D8DD520
MNLDHPGVATFSVGLLVEASEGTPPGGLDGDTPDGEVYTDAAGRHRMGSSGRLGISVRLVPQLGEAAVRTAARAVASQIALVADEISAELARRPDPTAEGANLAIDEAEITFGLKLTASSGAGLSALFTAKSESNVEVAITLKRQTS